MGRQHGGHRPQRTRPCTYRNHCQQRARQYHHPWLAKGGEERRRHERPCSQTEPRPAAAGGKGRRWREAQAMAGREGDAAKAFPTHFLPAGAAPLRPAPARGGDASQISALRGFGTKEVPAPSCIITIKGNGWSAPHLARHRLSGGRRRPLPGAGGRGRHTPAPRRVPASGLDASAQPRRSRPVPHLEPAGGDQHLRTAPPVTPGALLRAPPCASQRGLTRPSIQPKGSRPVPAVCQARPAAFNPSAQPPKPQPASTRHRSTTSAGYHAQPTSQA